MNNNKQKIVNKSEKKIKHKQNNVACVMDPAYIELKFSERRIVEIVRRE